MCEHFILRYGFNIIVVIKKSLKYPMVGFEKSFFLFNKLFLEDINPYCRASDTPVLVMSAWVPNPRWIPELHAFSPACNGLKQYHLCYC